MTTQEVANRYYELAKENNWPQILEELCSAALVNIEPEHVTARGIHPITKGLDAIKAKGIANREMIEAIHSQYCSVPLVAAGFFSVMLSRDFTFKGQPRMQKEELGVFEVKDGKIISEQFFY